MITHSYTPGCSIRVFVKVISLHAALRSELKSLEQQVVFTIILAIVYVYIASYYIANVRSLMFTLTCNYL